ncbi:MAG: hypothetical protein AAF628_35080 [Planctomycetota bacterium]
MAHDRALANDVEEDFDGFLDRWYAQPLFAPLARTAGFAALRARRRTGDPAALARALRTFSTGVQPCLTEQIAATKVPTLLLAGAADAKYAAMYHALQRPGASAPPLEVELIADAGHAVPFEQPAALSRTLSAFVSRHEEA